jgi:tetratricopeptide (TPR) repeat protein
MAKGSIHFAKKISRCAIVLIGAAPFLSGCDRETQTGDPRQLILNGWQQFRLEDYSASDRAFASAIDALGRSSLPQDEVQRLRAGALYGRGILWSLRRPGRDAARSKEYLNAAINADPKNEIAEWSRAALVRDEHFPERSDIAIDEAKLKTAYEQLANSNPDSAISGEMFIYRQSLLVQSLTPEDARLAIKEIDAYIAAGKKYYISPLLMLKARAHQTLGEHPQVLAARIEAVKRKEIDKDNPFMNNAMDYYQIALIAEYDVGDFEIAREYFNKFIAEYPFDSKAFICKRELTRMDLIEKAGGDTSAGGELGMNPPGVGGLPGDAPMEVAK